MRLARTLALLAVVALALPSAPARAAFHLMQIEQVMGGAGGDTAAQAIQLRMRTGAQNMVQNTRLRVRDAAGLNPITLFTFPSNVANGNTGDRILVTTAAFQALLSPTVTPDFLLTTPIPSSHLAAGSLTFEASNGIIYWRLSWGGAGYTGSGSGSTLNDPDGNFNPPFAGPLPSSDDRALLFQNAATAQSTNSAADYALTAAAATFTNNAGQSGTVTLPTGIGAPLAPARLDIAPPSPSPSRGAFAWELSLPRAALVRVRVVDVAGRVVRTLVDQPLAAGRHRFAADLAAAGAMPAAGVYTLVVDAGGERAGRRFVIVR